MDRSALDAIVDSAPRGPGVYLMKGREGEVLYVGKAKDLRSRLKSYAGGTDGRFMIPFLVGRLEDVEFIVTATEKEALLLENTLIKEHRPRYNVDFRDDKAYFHIRLDMREPFPRYQLVRRPRKDGARYFGPFPSSASARETLSFLHGLFPLRTCRDTDFRGRRRPCLEYQIRRCSAPCTGLIEAGPYAALVSDSLAFLEGRERVLLGDLRRRMEKAAEALRFEEAALLRDRIGAIERVLEKQHVLSMTHRDRDVFGIHGEEHLTRACVLFVRKGKVTGQLLFPPIRLALDREEILSALLKRYYDGEVLIPPEILLPVDIPDREVVAEWLSDRSGRRVALSVPRRGEPRKLVEMAVRNALQVARAPGSDPRRALELAAEKLSLNRIPERIECFDIASLGAEVAVGSKVAFREGRPDRGRYRRYRVRTVEGIDDYGMMYEVLRRRLSGSEEPPDLIVVDGGKGHLRVALSALRDTGVKDVEVVALAKESREHPPGGREPRGDRVFLPGRKDALDPSRWPPLLHLLQQVRDEAHRFAQAYLHQRKAKNDLTSALDKIPGVGPGRREALLKALGSAAAVRKADVPTLQKAGGIGKKTAERIAAFFRESPGGPAGS
ncbi:MAG: excinuclease ABC subunit UvrC [Syntrophaceae bacterium]|nr:excinuclease ABC subunit UvrC [Syntrophaceae bacterium]